MKKMSGGQMVVEVLQRENVEKAFCVPGESYLGVIDSLYEHPNIDLIATRHESGAAFMAEAYAKATNQVGICMATRGPGATNLSIGLHTAMQDSTPVVAIIGQVERPFLGKEAFQEVDFQAYFKHLCKWAVEIDTVERIPELLQQAFFTAKSGRPGPVVVSLPHDMLEDVHTYHENKPTNYNAPAVDEDMAEQIVHQLTEAKRPIIIAGGGVLLSEAEAEFRAFSEQLQIPVVSSFRRFNVLPNEHDHYAGWLGFGANPKLITTIQEADVVLVMGTRLSQVASQNYTLLHPDEQTIIQIDIASSTIGKAFPVDVAVISDIKKFLQICLPFIKRQQSSKKNQYLQKVHKQYLAHSTIQKKNEHTDYASLNNVMEHIVDIVPENSIITSDAGNFYGWLARYFRFSHAKRYIGPTSGAMGYGFPAALGAKVGRPNEAVISFSGDGGFMMTMQELETAVREQIHVIAIVVNNNMYGTIRAHQEKQFPNRVMATTLTNPSFSKIAKLYGCDGATVRDHVSFRDVFIEALESKSNVPYVIEVQTNPDILSVNEEV